MKDTYHDGLHGEQDIERECVTASLRIVLLSIVDKATYRVTQIMPHF